MMYQLKGILMASACFLSSHQGDFPIFDARKGADSREWSIVNDSVMGGRSKSNVSFDPASNHVLFSGEVSTENNGGFASLRFACDSIRSSGYSNLILRIKGDGKRYQCRLRSDKGVYYSFIAYFETSGEWEEIALPLSAFQPAFRGRMLNFPPFHQENIQEIGFLIGNKRAEIFSLEIAFIGLGK